MRLLLLLLLVAEAAEEEELDEYEAEAAPAPAPASEGAAFVPAEIDGGWRFMLAGWLAGPTPLGREVFVVVLQ